MTSSLTALLATKLSRHSAARCWYNKCVNCQLFVQRTKQLFGYRFSGQREGFDRALEKKVYIKSMVEQHTTTREIVAWCFMQLIKTLGYISCMGMANASRISQKQLTVQHLVVYMYINTPRRTLPHAVSGGQHSSEFET